MSKLTDWAVISKLTYWAARKAIFLQDTGPRPLVGSHLPVSFPSTHTQKICPSHCIAAVAGPRRRSGSVREAVAAAFECRSVEEEAAADSPYRLVLRYALWKGGSFFCSNIFGRLHPYLHVASKLSFPVEYFF